MERGCASSADFATNDTSSYLWNRVLSNRQVLGTGGVAGYDGTLNGKVLDLAIREAVERLVEGLEAGRWHPTAAGR